MPHMTLSPVEGRLDVQTEFMDKELVKQCPGTYWDAGRRVWHCPKTWAACLQMRGIFGDRLTISDELDEWAAAERARVEYARYLARLVNPPEGGGVEGLYPWQVVDFQWAWTVLADAAEGRPQGALLGNDQGTGKTVSGAVVLANLEGALPALVVCPNTVKRVWRDEIPRWIPDANVYVVVGPKAKRDAAIAAWLRDDRGVLVMNYEALRGYSRLAPYGSVKLKRCPACGGEDPITGQRPVTAEDGSQIVVDGVPQFEEYVTNAAEVVEPKNCQVHPRVLNGTGHLRTVILDEAQALADPKSQQTRACWSVCHDPSVTRCLATTGTPISNHIGDLWGIMHAVQRDEYPVRSGFIERYGQLEWNDHGGMSIVGIRADNAAELFGFLDRRYRRVTKEQAAPWLPPKVRSKRFVELPTKIRKAYDEMDRKLITRLEDGTVLFAPTELTQSGRLVQLASSYGTVEQVEEPQSETGWSEKFILTDPKSAPSPKIDALLEVLSELGPERPLAAFAVSKQLIKLASARLASLNISHGMIHGDVGGYERDRALDEFQAGRLRCLLFNTAGSKGLTMTRADTIVRLQRSWSILENLQVEDRAHRIGSEIHEKIHVVDVVAEDTIEEWQLIRLWQKLTQLEQLRRDGVDPMQWLLATGDDLRTCVYEEAA